MSEVVAVEGDTEYQADILWEYVPGTHIETPCSNFRVEGKFIIVEAKVTFQLIANPAITDPVTLSPQSTILRVTESDLQKHVLRNGDSQTSPQGNVLKVKDNINNILKCSLV